MPTTNQCQAFSRCQPKSRGDHLVHNASSSQSKVRYASPSTTTATCGKLGCLGHDLQESLLGTQHSRSLSAQVLLCRRLASRCVYPRHRRTPHQPQKSCYLVLRDLETLRLPTAPHTLRLQPDSHTGLRNYACSLDSSNEQPPIRHATQVVRSAPRASTSPHDFLPDVICSVAIALRLSCVCRTCQNNGKTRHVEAVCDTEGIGTFVEAPELPGKLSQGVTTRLWLTFAKLDRTAASSLPYRRRAAAQRTGSVPEYTGCLLKAHAVCILRFVTDPVLAPM